MESPAGLCRCRDGLWSTAAASSEPSMPIPITSAVPNRRRPSTTSGLWREALHHSRLRSSTFGERLRSPDHPLGGRMRSIISANLFPRAAAAFVVGGLAVLVVHQPVVAMLHALGSTPLTPYSLRATRPWGIPVFLSLSFWGGIWTIPIAWVLDRLPRGWVYWVGAVCLGALPPTLTTWFVIFPLKGLSPSNASASVGAVNALIVNGIWGLAIPFAWFRIFAVSPKTPAPVPYTPASSGRG